jgi:hypothetical protein
MAYAFRRQNKGTPSFIGMYMGRDGNRRSAGTFGSRRAALRAAQREEQQVPEGRWRDRRLGEMPFTDYVENVWFPSKHPELSTRAGYRLRRPNWQLVWDEEHVLPPHRRLFVPPSGPPPRPRGVVHPTMITADRGVSMLSTPARVRSAGFQ